MDYLKDIIADIHAERCVVIIWPDILDCGDRSFFEVMSAEIISKSNIVDAAPQYVFANEELFQLLAPRKITALERMIEDFYGQQTALDAPLEKITQIPFHLIISLMPDDRLIRLFKQQELEFNYSHYPREGVHEPVERPVKGKPLVYNLLGDIKEGSAIITFEHMFKFLSGVMGSRELPQPIQVALKKARTFVFIGVQFEKWYVQLLLRIITTSSSSDDKKDKYTTLKNSRNNDVCMFIARRLELDFLETEPQQFLDRLYEECKQQDVLKTAKSKRKIKVFISYSHADKEIVGDIGRFLISQDLEIVIDDSSMRGGEKIDDFISIISDVDIVLPVLSRNSLLSPWVSKEIITTIERTDKHLLPCYIDKDFLDNSFESKAKEIVTGKVRQINELISQRGVSNTEDLDSEKKNWTEYFVNLPRILGELKKRKCISLMQDERAVNLDTVVSDIKLLAGKE